MNVATQIDGERIAKDVIAEAEAQEVLGKRPRLFTQWNYWFAIIFSSAWGSFIATYTGHNAQLFLGVIAGIALLVGLAALQECLSLRRRLDAVLVLVRTREG